MNIACFVQNSELDFKIVFFGIGTLITYKQLHLLSKAIISVYKFSFGYLSFQTLA